MSFMGRVSKFASSPQGKKLMRQTQDFARDPDTKKKIAEVSERFTKRKKPA